MANIIEELKKTIQNFGYIRQYVAKLEEELEEKHSKAAVAAARLKYYENANSPPSLQYRADKRKSGGRAEGEQTSTGSTRKAGSQAGHKGVSSKCNPDIITHHI